MEDKYKKIKLGSFNEVKEIIKKLNDSIGSKEKKSFALVKMEGPNSFWLVQEDSEDDIRCGVVTIDGEKVFAVSKDVYDFVFGLFSKVL